MVRGRILVMVRPPAAVTCLDQFTSRLHINAEWSIRHQRNGASKYVIRYSHVDRRRRSDPISFRIGTYFTILRLTKRIRAYET